MTDNSLVLRQDASLPAQGEWHLMREMAASLVPTGFLPDSIRTPEQAVAIMLKGRELHVPPMYALSNIVIVKGKPTISAEMMLALIYRDHGKKAIRVKSSDDRQCTVEYRLDGWDDVSSYTFSIEQAQKAGLTRNPTWNAYPAAMLRARCISAVARMAFPESIAGMYVPGELGDDVAVNDDGEVISVSSAIISDERKQELTIIADRVADEIEMATPPPKPEKSPQDKAIARIHAVANNHGLDHDDIHNMIVALGGTSTKKADPSDLHTLSDRIEANPGKAREWAASLRPQEAPAAPESDEATEPESGPANGELNFGEDVIPTPAGLADRYTHN